MNEWELLPSSASRQTKSSRLTWSNCKRKTNEQKNPHWTRRLRLRQRKDELGDKICLENLSSHQVRGNWFSQIKSNGLFISTIFWLPLLLHIHSIHANERFLSSCSLLCLGKHQQKLPPWHEEKEKHLTQVTSSISKGQINRSDLHNHLCSTAWTSRLCSEQQRRTQLPFLLLLLHPSLSSLLVVCCHQPQSACFYFESRGTSNFSRLECAVIDNFLVIFIENLLEFSLLSRSLIVIVVDRRLESSTMCRMPLNITNTTNRWDKQTRDYMRQPYENSELLTILVINEK